MLDLALTRWITSRRPTPTPAVLAMRCREIGPSDLDAVIDLLIIGFPNRRREYWVKCFDRLTQHHTPAGFPKYGYMLENGGVPIGVILLIFTERLIDGVPTIWCNESSYYVEPHFRPYGSIMIKRYHRFKEVTFLDLTPSTNRLASMELQGYKQFAKGVFFAIPILARSQDKVSVHAMDSTFTGLEPSDIELLNKHSSYGECICLVCDHEGQLYPFVFAKRSKYGIPFAYLVYSKNQGDFIKFASPIGWYLAKRGMPLVALDTAGPLGVPGKMTKRRPKFWLGPARPRLGDLAYTEIPMFGVI